MIVKFISNVQADLVLDQEFIVLLEANKLFKYDLDRGTYLLEVIPTDKNISPYTQDLLVSDIAQQLVRIYHEKTSDDLLPNVPLDNKIIDTNDDLLGINKKNFETIYQDEDYIIRRNEKKIISISANTNDIIGEYEIVDEIDEYQEFAVSKQHIDCKTYGFINIKGKEILPFIYEQATNFNRNNIAKVKRFGIERFINRDGRVWMLNDCKKMHSSNEVFFLLDSNQYDWCGILIEPNEQSYFYPDVCFLPVIKNNKWGLCQLEIIRRYHETTIDSVKVTEIVKCVYDEIISIYIDKSMILFRQGENCILVNFNGSKYEDNSELKGQYIIAPPGEIFYKAICEHIYPIVKEKVIYKRNDYYYDKKCLAYSPHSYVLFKNGKYGICTSSIDKIKYCYDDVFLNEMNGNSSKSFYENIPLIVKQNQFFGLVNSTGIALTQVDYQYIHFTGEVFIAKKNNRYTFLDKKGEKLTNKGYDDIYFENGSYIVKSKGKYGVFSIENYDLLIKCQFEKIEHIEYKTNFIERTTDYAYLCSKDGKYGIINKYGEKKLDYKFDEIIVCEFHSQGQEYIGGYLLKKGTRCGFYSPFRGIILKCQFDEIVHVSTGSETYFVVRNNDQWGCYECSGKKVFDFLYDSVKYLDDCNNNGDYVARFACLINRRNYIIDVNHNSYGYVECDDIIPLWYSSNYCLVRKGSYYGFNINVFTTILRCEYDLIKVLEIDDDNIYFLVVENGNKRLIIYNQNNRRIKLSHNLDCDDLFAVSNSIVHEFEYYYYSNGDVFSFVFNKDGKQGIMDIKGEIILPAIYDEITHVEQSSENDSIYVYIKQNNLLGIIGISKNRQDRIVPFEYHKIKREKNNFIVYKDDCCGLYSCKGNILLSCIFEENLNLNANQLSTKTKLLINPKTNSYIPVEIWRSLDNKFVAFNLESGIVIIETPQLFDDLVVSLERYKKNYLKNIDN